MMKDADVQETLPESYFKVVLDYVRLRQLFKYGYREIFHYIFHCLCFRKGSFKKGYKEYTKHNQYNKGTKKLEHELDVVNLVREIRELRLMSQVLLGPNERMLLKFQRRNLIELASSSSDSDHHNHDTLKLLNGKNNFLKLGQIVKINNILK